MNTREQELIQIYKHRIRVFLILYIFSENYKDDNKPNCRRLFESETRIQKIDFWLRNPDYLSYELLKVAKKNHQLFNNIKRIVKEIFHNKEPEIRREEMKKFRFGAYEDLDDVIGFLVSTGLIEFDSKRAENSTVRNKKYFITNLAVEKMQINISHLTFLKWYVDRCNLIKRFFGDKSATELKTVQYEIEQYSNAPYGSPIKGIFSLVEREYYNLYNEKL